MIHLSIRTPTDFHFTATVKSHGWYRLAPYHYDEASGILERPYQLDDGHVVNLKIRGGQSRSILVDVIGRPIISSRDRNNIMMAVRYSFNLQQDLRPFYTLMSKTENYEWVTERKAARLLASPTVWEDLVKTLLTTNTSWANTEKMAANLSQLDPHNIFPSPYQIASFGEDDLAEKTGIGYRSAYLLQLAQRVVSGELDIENWRTLDSEALYKAIKDLHGFGDYAAGTVMRLLGHFDKLAIDTVARSAYEQLTGTAPESDSDIHDYYEQFGKWRGLVLWMDCIREEVSEKEKAMT